MDGFEVRLSGVEITQKNLFCDYFSKVQGFFYVGLVVTGPVGGTGLQKSKHE